MRLVSWNVNGIRACERKGFMTWLRAARPQVVGLQEVRALPEQVPEPLRRARFHQEYAPAERLGYSGVALLSRRRPDAVETRLAPRFDVEGRVLIGHFGRLTVVNAYFPKGDGPNRDLSRIPYKLAFYRALLRRVSAFERVIVMGDFNTAHRPLDLARPKENEKNSGFRPEERRALDAWMRAGFVDTFRHFYPEASGCYTWWSQRAGLRERNVGWRIDYVLANQAAMPFVTRAFIQPEERASDHCPVGIDVRDAIMK